MDPQNVHEKSEEHESKRQRMDVEDEQCENIVEDISGETSSDSSDYDPDDLRLFHQELEKHGEYDFDPSNVGSMVWYQPVVFGECIFAEEPETDGELVHRLSQRALDQYNDDNKGKSLELVRAVKANWSVGGGPVFSITLDAKDASQAGLIVPFHAKVRYFPWDSTVVDVKPKP